MKDPMLDDFESLERAHAELGARMMRPTSRAEELIADLEAEIVKRDSRIAELKKEVVVMACMTASTPLVIEQQRGGVVLPERMEVDGNGGWRQSRAEAHNACLDEVARLNPPGESVAVPRVITPAMLAAAFDLTGESESMRSRVNERTSRLYAALIAQQGKAVGDE